MNRWQHERREPLRDGERSTLRRGLAFLALFAAICVGIFGAMIGIGGSMPESSLFLGIVVTVASLFALLVGVQMRRILLDLADGEVIVREGVVTGKQQHVSSGKGRSRRSYRLRVDDGDVDVDAAQYHATREGQRIVLRMGPHSKRVFSLNAVDEESAEPAPDPASRPLATLDLREEAFTDDDRSLLASRFRAFLLRRLLAIAVSAWFFAYFLLEGYWGLLLLVSPAVLFFLWHTSVLLRTLPRSAAARAPGRKNVARHTVVDRQIVRRRREHCELHVGGSRLTVERDLYERIAVGDLVDVHTAPRTGWQLRVERVDAPRDAVRAT
jgi:hypothetical protein